LPSCLSAQRTVPAGACGKGRRRCERTGRKGTCSGYDRSAPCGADCLRSPAPQRGGELDRFSGPANVSKRRSEHRDCVASLSAGRTSDKASQVHSQRDPRRQICAARLKNQTHANQMIVMREAVPGPPATGFCLRSETKTSASALPDRVSEAETPARSLQPRSRRCQTGARSVSLAGTVRFARLCVLIKPNPARRSVLRDLDRVLHPL
jgi:hypothetical protein